PTACRDRGPGGRPAGPPLGEEPPPKYPIARSPAHVDPRPGHVEGRYPRRSQQRAAHLSTGTHRMTSPPLQDGLCTFATQQVRDNCEPVPDGSRVLWETRWSASPRAKSRVETPPPPCRVDRACHKRRPFDGRPPRSPTAPSGR